MKNMLSLLVILLAFSLFSCQPSNIEKNKRSLKKAATGQEASFNFEVLENEAGLTTTLGNEVLQEPIRLESETANVLLGYVSHQEGAGEATIYQSNLIKQDKSLHIEVTNLSTNETEKIAFPTPTTDIADPFDGTFDSFEDCFNYFDCAIRPGLQEEANRTCKAVPYAFICCTTNNQCISVHYLIQPTRITCRFQVLIPDLPLLVAPF